MNTNLILKKAFFLLLMIFFCKSDQIVTFVQKENQIDILFDGNLFTTYLFEPDMAKPILYPVHSPSGIMVNRGFPLMEIEGESRDHPHHAGIWFACDEVNGNKFWNTSEPPPQIKLMKVSKLQDGKSEGTLSTVSHWIGVNGQILFEENRTMVFYPADSIYAVDFTITLTAKDTTVTIHDTKEGMFAIRVADWLSEKNGTGLYLSSNGDETEKEVWGTRANWVRLEGERDGKRIGVVILNHPGSTNYPTFWMARGYGLFSANPIGQYVYQKHHQVENAQPLNLALNKGESALFKFRLILYENETMGKQIDRIFENYSKN
jgi:hypothetical protein